MYPRKRKEPSWHALRTYEYTHDEQNEPLTNPLTATAVTRTLTLLGLQPRSGDKLLTIWLIFVPKTGLRGSKKGHNPSVGRPTKNLLYTEVGAKNGTTPFDFGGQTRLEIRVVRPQNGWTAVLPDYGGPY